MKIAVTVDVRFRFYSSGRQDYLSRGCAMKNIRLLLFMPFIFCRRKSCSKGEDKIMADYLENPEEVHIITVPANSLSRELIDHRSNTVKGFPFVAHQAVNNFKGKFSPEFYTSMDRKVRAETLKDVDFWSLDNNPALYDVIYVKPLWLGDLKLKNNNLLESIAYSYNISTEQLAILKAWIQKGGILWMESGIYISAYDYNFNKFDDRKLGQLMLALSGLNLEGSKLNVKMLKAKKTDPLHVETLFHEMHFNKMEKRGDIEVINDKIGSLLIEQTDYIGIYISVDGVPIIKSNDSVYASYIKSGKGIILTLAPFDFKNAYFDGELFRFTLLTWALDNRNNLEPLKSLENVSGK